MWATWFGVTRLFQIDPFADFRPSGVLEKGLELGEFQLRSYQGSRLIAFASVRSATARRDRSLLDMVGLFDGKLTSDSGDIYNFEAPQAAYGTFNKSIVLDRGGRVWNARLDLSMPKATYDGIGKVMRVEGPVTGKLEGGDLVADGVMMDVGKQDLLVRTFEWQGQAGQEGKGRQMWKVKGENSRLSNDIWTGDNGRAESSDTIVYGKKIELDRKQDILTVTGDVRYYGVDANMTCEKVIVYRKEGRSVLVGTVHMLIKPEEGAKVEEVVIPPLTPVVPDEVSKDRPAAPRNDQEKTQEDAVRDRDNLRKYPATVIADRIEYWYKKGERRAHITGSPQARQELPGQHWRRIWGYEAFYDGEKDRLKVVSSAGKKEARMKNSLGDDLACIDVLVSTKKGEDLMDATEPEGVVSVREKDVPEKPGGGGKGGSTGGGSGTPSVSGPIGDRRRS